MTKADPLAPAYPGIKPEWYFLWEYQLLKEFPPHLFGLEGPQVCLFLIAILFGIWAIIPWLDRRAYQNKPSPAFSDFGWAAILFLTYLTLMGWDIGATGAGDDSGALHKSRGSVLGGLWPQARSSSCFASGGSPIAGFCSPAQRCCRSCCTDCSASPICLPARSRRARRSLPSLAIIFHGPRPHGRSTA